MRSGPPPLLPLLRSRVLGDLLALLYLHPDQDYSLTEAATLIGASVKTVHTEAATSDHSRVRPRLPPWKRPPYSGCDRPVHVSRPLTDLLAVTYGPLPVLSDLLAGVEGITHAFIYGSWAARYTGEPGPVPGDVDVLVVGAADPDSLESGSAGRPASAPDVRWTSAGSVPLPGPLLTRRIPSWHRCANTL